MSSRRRSRSSSALRSGDTAKDEYIGSLVQSIKSTFVYLIQNTGNIDAIDSIHAYIKEKTEELDHFGRNKVYNVQNFKPAAVFVDEFNEKKNVTDNNTNAIRMTLAKNSGLSIANYYAESLTQLWENAPGGTGPLLEKYIRNRIMDTLAFCGSPVIFRDLEQTATIISQFNASMNQ